MKSTVKLSVEAEANQESLSLSSFEGQSQQLVYREMAEIPVQIVDPVEEFYRQLESLRDAQARLQFFVREIRSQIKG